MAETIPPPTGQRTLAAILFTDVVGFSALMQKHEDRTLQLLERDFAEMRRLCTEHEGTVLKTTGDGLLCTFASAVKAVACAVAMQRSFANRGGAPAVGGEHLQHRIGIHLGDVLVQAQDVMGDGVNIASRLQAEAEPGGICISQTVYDVVKNKLALQTTYIGPRELKNISDAIPAYRVLIEAEAGSGNAGSPSADRADAAPTPASNAPETPLWTWVGGITGVAVFAALVYMYVKRPHAISPTAATTTAVAVASPAAPPASTPSPAPAGQSTAPTAAAPSAPAAAAAPIAAAAPTNSSAPTPAEDEFANLSNDPKKFMAEAHQRFLRHYDFEAFSRALEHEASLPGGKPMENAQRWARDLVSLREWMEQRLSGYDEQRPLRVTTNVANGRPAHFSVFGISHTEIGVVANGSVQHREIADLAPAQFGDVILALLQHEGRPPGDIMVGAHVFARVFKLQNLRDALDEMKKQAEGAQQQHPAPSGGKQ